MPTEEWDLGADAYVQLPDVSNVKVVHPAVLRHLGNVKGKTILDYGCGDGRFCRTLAEDGAAVIGTDISEPMMQIAERMSQGSNIRYEHMKGNSLDFLPDESVDAVNAILVFMMCSTQEEIAQSFKEIHRVLKKGGTFVNALTHPCFVDKGAHDYRNEFSNGFDYMKQGYPYRFVLQDGKGQEIDEKFYDHHYNLTTYLNQTFNAGFSITGFEELSYPKAVAQKHNVPPQFLTFPQSLVIIGQK